PAPAQPRAYRRARGGGAPSVSWDPSLPQTPPRREPHEDLRELHRQDQDRRDQDELGFGAHVPKTKDPAEDPHPEDARDRRALPPRATRRAAPARPPRPRPRAARPPPRRRGWPARAARSAPPPRAPRAIPTARRRRAARARPGSPRGGPPRRSHRSRRSRGR